MRFELSRTTAEFGKYNPRLEQNKGNAFDITFTVTVGADVLSMLVPAQEPEQIEDELIVPPAPVEDRLMAELYSEEGYVRRPAISPINIHRTPEGVTVTIWDDPDDDGSPLILKPCRFKSLVATLKSPHRLQLDGMIQYPQYTDAELLRVNRVCYHTYDIAWVVDQVDLFETAGAEAEQDAKQPEDEGSE